ncbi:DUF6612 family protein [Anaerobacillus isosaccharinicus]|uniref:DUF6612 family protein n=1 Tax=Anaerobacillus isosaccharinicus TaxID=1532552 RepID=A0A7S7RDJ6_9BACI|nr:DUF6612 family protein [Anaerobacillus isosaccharinicus]MBA5588520.1 hypothetical protein [Anaerobacillus isosaccharinicus]QOY38058.1 hypothetical protein AWH56_011245 [Anaerobacillus isosaccharinicus]
MFKRLKVLGAALALVVVLAACNDQVATNLTDAEDVLKQSLEVMEKLDSYSMTMESEQTMTINDSETMNMVMKINADMTLNPLAFHQKLSMESDMDMMGKIETEMYLVGDQVFMFDPMMKEWMELPMDLMGDLGGLSELQLSPDQQLLMLRSFADDIELSENGSNYVLKLSGEGSEFMEIAKFFGGAGNELEEMLEFFSELKLNHIDYEIYIDKETFYQTKLNMTMDLTMGMEGETIHTIQTMKATIHGINEVGEIKLPEEVLN